MSQPVILKVYGNLFPASAQLANALRQICASAMPEAEGIVTLDGDLLRISFEGIYFPVEEVLLRLREDLKSGQTGKLDVLDLENWTLARHIFADGEISSAHAPLNNVLNYSGH